MVTRPSPTTTTDKRATSTAPRSPGRSPTRRATSTAPRSPASSPTRRATSTAPRSPTRGTNGHGRASNRRSAQAQATDNTVSRAVQFAMLIVGMLLFMSFLFGGQWGVVSIGLMVFASAFPPLRRHVDRWLVGTPYGDEADQAAILRIAAGVGIVAFVVIFLR